MLVKFRNITLNDFSCCRANSYQIVYFTTSHNFYHPTSLMGGRPGKQESAGSTYLDFFDLR